MKTFKYLAKDPLGEEKKGFLTAFTELEGREQLQAFGLTEIQIVEVPKDFLEKQREAIREQEAERSEEDKHEKKKPEEAPKDLIPQYEASRLLMYAIIPVVLILGYFLLLKPLLQDRGSFGFWIKGLTFDVMSIPFVLGAFAVLLIVWWLYSGR